MIRLMSKEREQQIRDGEERIRRCFRDKGDGAHVGASHHIILELLREIDYLRSSFEHDCSSAHNMK